jgi:hypothetical protein
VTTVRTAPTGTRRRARPHTKSTSTLSTSGCRLTLFRPMLSRA